MTGHPESRELQFDDNELASTLYGDLNKNLQILENGAGVKIHVRGTRAKITGSQHDVIIAANLLNQLYDLITTGYPVYSSDFAFGLKILQANGKARLDRIFLDKVYVTTRNRVISPQNPKPENLYRRHQRKRYRFRHWPGGHRQNLPGCGHGGLRLGQ